MDAQSFAKGQLMVEGLKVGLHALKRIAESVFDLGPQTAEYADHMSKLSQETGIGTGSLQELAHAAKMSDISLDEAAHSLGFLARNMNGAAQGSKEQARAFRDLGVNVKDAHTHALRPLDDVLGDLAARFQAMPDGPRKSALAMEVFGRGGRQMIPLLNQGRDGLAGLRREAHDLGLVLDESAIQKGAEADDAVKRMSESWKGLKLQLGAGLLPVLIDLTGGITRFLKAHRADIVGAMRAVVWLLTAAFKALWLVLWPIRALLGFIVDHFRLVATILGGVVLAAIYANLGPLVVLGAAYGTLAAQAVAAAVRTAASWALAIAPFVALALIVEDIVTYFQGGDSVIIPALKSIGSFFAGIWDDAVAFWRDLFTKFFAWVEDKATWLGRKLKEAFSIVVGTVGDPEELARRYQDAHKEVPTGAKLAIDRMQQFVLGGGGGVQRYGVTPGANVTSTTTINGGINVVVPPGSDPNTVHPIVKKAVKDAIREERGAQHRALIQGTP